MTTPGPTLSPDRGGPPGQTNLNNLGPFNRREHRHKTFGHLQVRQPAPGVYLWRSRHGWIWLVTNTGTQPPRPRTTAHALWNAAAPRLNGQPVVIDLFHPRKVQPELSRLGR